MIEQSEGKMSESYSESVKGLLQRLSTKKEVFAEEIVNDLLKLHDEYAEGKAKGMHVETRSDSEHRPIMDWLREVRSHYDIAKQPELNGRLIILGLSRLDDKLAKQLKQNDFLNILKKEHEPPFDSILSENGRKAWGIPVKDKKVLIEDEKFQSDRTYMHPDSPAIEDELGRKPFAEALASHLRYIQRQHMESNQQEKDQAFFLHLCGPWGSGKTTMLRFLQRELEQACFKLTTFSFKKLKDEGIPDTVLKSLEHLEDKEFTKDELLNAVKISIGKEQANKYKNLILKQVLEEKGLSKTEENPINTEPWVVVTFNAWQHQQIDPPWWALMNSVFQQAYERLRSMKMRRDKIRLWINEYDWRARTVFTSRFFAVLIFALLLFGLMVMFHFGTEPSGNGNSLLSAFIKNIETIDVFVGLLVAIAGVAHSISRSLLPGTAPAAQTFVKISRNPMPRLTQHFTELVKWINKPVAVFIDDLDRCDARYVVKFLERIQTLFRDASVVYVVAADKRWLRTSYETTYQAFSNSVKEPGIPLGYLFTEKIFQISIPMPAIPEYYKNLYWRRRVKGVESETDQIESWKSCLQEAESDLSQASSDEEIAAKVKAQDEKEDMRKLAYQMVSMKRSVDPNVQQAREHRLQKYKGLVGSNPRAMKRMVNAYTVCLLLKTIARLDIDSETLPLWTILSMRWPSLAEYLSGHPELGKYIGQPTEAVLKQIPERLHELFQDKAGEVQAVVNGEVNGKKLGGRLDEDTICLCAKLNG